MEVEGQGVGGEGRLEGQGIKLIHTLPANKPRVRHSFLRFHMTCEGSVLL